MQQGRTSVQQIPIYCGACIRATNHVYSSRNATKLRFTACRCFLSFPTYAPTILQCVLSESCSAAENSLVYLLQELEQDHADMSSHQQFVYSDASFIFTTALPRLSFQGLFSALPTGFPSRLSLYTSSFRVRYDSSGYSMAYHYASFSIQMQFSSSGEQEKSLSVKEQSAANYRLRTGMK